MGRKQLCLVPSEAEQIPADLQELLTGLREIGFVGDEFDFYDETQYRPGANFLKLVHFYASHPITRLKHVDGELVPVEVIDSRDDCAITLDDVTLTPEFLGGPCTIAPQCPKCGYAEEEWGEMLNDWYYRKAEHRWVCPNCQTEQRVYDLDWQDGAAIGRFQIIIEGIAYEEAAPTQQLLDALLRITGFSWKYFYWDDNPSGMLWD